VIYLLRKNDRAYYRSSRSLVLAIAAGPRQAILRPAEIERTSFHEDLLQTALFGPRRIFTPAKPTVAVIEDHALVLNHDDGAGTVKLDAQRNLVIKLPLMRPVSRGEC